MENNMDIKHFNYLPNEAKEIRIRVFVEEQGFKNEFDEVDSTATHIICYIDNTAIATGRLFLDENSKEYHIGRIAVDKPYRGKGIGGKILNYAENLVKEMGGKTLSLSAQERVSQFYEKQGYCKKGEPYLDEYCPHIFMTKKLV